MLLVHPGATEDAEPFFAERWPEARAASDENAELYAAFGLGRASLGQMLGPRVFLAGLKALRHGVGRPVGNPLLQSGWFLVAGDEVVWAHVHEHVGVERRGEELTAVYRDLREPQG